MSDETGWPESGTSRNCMDGCNSRMRATISGERKSLSAPLSSRMGQRICAHFSQSRGTSFFAEAAVNPEHIGVVLGYVFACVI